MPNHTFLEQLKTQMKEAEERIAETRKEIELAERGGVDVTEQRRELERNIAQLNRLRATYFPTAGIR